MNNWTELTEFSEIRNFMKERLVADPAALGLNPRLEECPENLFEIIAHKGQFDNVVRALNELMFVFFDGVNQENITETMRFMKSSLRLCDALQPVRCKNILKTIILEDDQIIWGEGLLDLQDLAAQALLGLPKEKADFRYWSHIAHKWRPSLPYALHAAIEIDLEEGLYLFWELYLKDPREDHPLVDWPTIINEADEHYSDKEISQLLEKSFYRVIGTKDPLRFETIIWLRLNIRRFTRVKDRSVSEEPFSYTIATRPSLKNEMEQQQYPKAIGYPIGQTTQADAFQKVFNAYVTKGFYVGLNLGYNIKQASLNHLRY